MYIYGRHPVMEALENGAEIEKVLVLKGTGLELEKQVRTLAKEANVHVQVVPKERFRKWKDVNHRGLVAMQASISYHELEDLVPSILADSKAATFLILDNITDVRNVGAIARSAVCFGVDAIIVPAKGSARIGAEAIKSSAGALEKIPICRVANLSTTLGYLQNNDVYLYATDLEAEKAVTEVDTSVHKALLIGSEGKGVSKHLLKAADETFIVPQVTDFDSLNVSVATGIILYEMLGKK